MTTFQGNGYELSEEYRLVLQGYLAQAGELPLVQAYEFGRKALSRGLGVVQIAIMHQEALATLVGRLTTPEESAHTIRNAATVESECLSVFEMALRGFRVSHNALTILNEQLRQQAEELARANEELRRRNAEIEEDLRMARELQEAFLSHPFSTIPLGRSAVRFYSRYLPASIVGGDFFDIRLLPNEQLGVFLGDAMGHGTRAALLTAMLRTLVEEHMPVANEPATFLSAMNHALWSIFRRMDLTMFVTAFYMVIDPVAGVFRWANAGHPRPIHMHRRSGAAEFLTTVEKPNPALGMFESAPYAMHQIDLEPQDLLILFTDGLYEVENRGGEFFDSQRLIASVRDHARLPADQLFDELLRQIQEFSETRTFLDDVCLVGVEVERLATPVQCH